MNEREPTGVLALGPQRPTNSVAFSLALQDNYAGTHREGRHQSSLAVPRRLPRGFVAFSGLHIVPSIHTTSSSPPQNSIAARGSGRSSLRGIFCFSKIFSHPNASKFQHRSSGV
jgi:hypothetical protein